VRAVTEGLLVLERVQKSFPAPDGDTLIHVLRGIDLVVLPGRTIAILGPSGCGKTTLLSIMGIIDCPSAGRVLFRGRDVADLRERERAVVRRDGVGFIFQRHHLMPQCTAWENVLLPTLGKAARDRKDGAAVRARQLLERMGLGERSRHLPAELSGGECLRVAVARALINRPRLLLADEPTGSLDEGSAESLADLLVEVNREEGTSLVVVTHSARLAARMETRLALHDGKLAEAGRSG
jgi:lipoprotein-releasing system ATP-binding protein